MERPEDRQRGGRSQQKSAPAETESRQRRTGLKLRKATKMKTARSTQESEPRRFMSRSRPESRVMAVVENAPALRWRRQDVPDRTALRMSASAAIQALSPSPESADSGTRPVSRRQGALRNPLR